MSPELLIKLGKNSYLSNPVIFKYPWFNSEDFRCECPCSRHSIPWQTLRENKASLMDSSIFIALSHNKWNVRRLPAIPEDTSSLVTHHLHCNKMGVKSLPSILPFSLFLCPSGTVGTTLTLVTDTRMQTVNRE